MYKKVLSIIVCLLICIPITYSYAASTSAAFDLTLTRQFKQLGYWGTVASIMEEESGRAAVSCSLLIDLVSAGFEDFTVENFSDCLINPSNILSDGEFINVSGFFGHKVVHIAYDPVLEIVAYSIDDAGFGSDEFNSIFEKKKMEEKGFTVYINDSDEMQRVFYNLIGQD